MQKLISMKTPRITRNKKKLEKELGVKISTKGTEISIEGTPEDEYEAEKVLQAISMGFPLSQALMIKKDHLFEKLNIKNYTKQKNLERVKSRIIGTKGKTLKTLSDLTQCHLELQDSFLGIIGPPERMEVATQAIISLIQGSKQSNVYASLEKQQPKPLIDLGLKEK